ncbi:MAG: extracellular solute-binding protein [Oscillospiraceae bacterium]|jgi:putative aldouronate transport system substrate-binding protein|nr:extracellular solute-binding protein [Oscillospiraceae bacterium]
MRKLSAMLSALIVLAMAATCAFAATDAELEPFSKYGEPITISVGRMNNAGGNFAPGTNSENNAWTQLLKDELNIIIDVNTNGFDVDAADYQNTLMLRTASDTLPDTFTLLDDAKSTTLFKQLVEGGRLADLTEAYDKAIGGSTKERLAASDTQSLLQFLTVDGKLYGVTAGREAYNTAVLWVRQDWLDKLGLDVPQTLEDIEKVALAFVENKPGGNPNTIGIPLNPSTSGLGGMTGQWMGILPVFNAFGSYPDIWVNDAEGGVVWGGVQPETKEALALLADWYQKGVLDKNLVTMKDGDEVRNTYVSANGAGFIFNAWWDPWTQWDGLGDTSVKNDETIKWTPVMAPLNKDGKFSPKNESVTPGGQVVTAKSEHPEAVIKAMNLFSELSLRTPEFEDLYQKYIAPTEGVTEARTNSPFNTGLYQVQGRILTAENINSYLETGVLAVDPAIAGNAPYIEGAYEWANNNTMADWYANKNEDEINKYMQQYVGHWAFDVVGNMYLEGEKSGLYVEKQRGFVGSVDAQSDYGAMVNELQVTAFMQIISGAQPVDYFDEFVAQWHKLGGEEITKQVNEAVKGG